MIQHHDLDRRAAGRDYRSIHTTLFSYVSTHRPRSGCSISSKQRPPGSTPARFYFGLWTLPPLSHDAHVSFFFSLYLRSTITVLSPHISCILHCINCIAHCVMFCITHTHSLHPTAN